MKLSESLKGYGDDYSMRPEQYRAMIRSAAARVAELESLLVKAEHYVNIDAVSGHLGSDKSHILMHDIRAALAGGVK